MLYMNSSNFLYKKLLIFILLIVSLIYYAVVISNGTYSNWEQLNYFIIILSSYFFREKGSILSSIVVCFLMKLFMPLDGYCSIIQTQIGWLFRFLRYVAIGVFFTYIFNMNDKFQAIGKDNYFKLQIDGLYNSNKLLLDLKKLNKKQIKYHIAIIKITNINELCKYYDCDIINNINDFIFKKIHEMNHIFAVYLISQNKIIIIKKNTSILNFKTSLKIFLQKFNTPLKLNNYAIKLIIKIGIINERNMYSYTPLEIYKKLLISIDQGGLLESGLYIYDNEFANERKLYNEIANSLYSAIQEDKLYLVYQPVIDIKKNEISSCEILVRWDRGNKQLIGPDLFIKIAEDIGIIQLVTKWVIEHALKNYIIWKDNGCDINQSINITARELLDDEFRLWANSLFMKYNQSKKTCGLEITERVLSKNNSKLNKVLLDLQNKGYIIEIDDFGTGYNSLMFLGEIPSNVIKIDKYFIDKIYEEDMKIIIQKIISAVHKLGNIVIAEGVEEKGQYQILSEIGCDKIQGYYFSKPLESKDFLEYYKGFNFEDYN